jgi:hypothetical protein
MHRHILAGTTLAVALVAATGTFAAITKYGEASGWEVAVNDAMGPGCLVMKTADHLQVQIGLDATSTEPTSYMAVFTRADVPVVEGEVIPLEIEVGGRTFTGVAFGEQMEGFQGAWVPVNNAAFVDELAREETMTVTIADLPPVEVSLAGTDAAFQAMRACQDAQ